MFDNTNNSIFEDNDEFGLNAAREDFSAVFNANIITVKQLRNTANYDEKLPGNFLGVNKSSDVNAEDLQLHSLLNINIMSDNPEGAEVKRQGFSNKGVIQYNCYARWDADLKDSDVIEFVKDYGYNIRAGDRFRVELKDYGLYQGQYSFKNFTIYKI